MEEEKKEKRLYKNTHSSKYKDKENSINGYNKRRCS